MHIQKDVLTAVLSTVIKPLAAAAAAAMIPATLLCCWMQREKNSYQILTIGKVVEVGHERQGS